ncbi:hypothetical protein ES708_29126 [subsurface metagenome]
MALSDLALVDLIQAKAYLRIDAAASLHVDAEYVDKGDDATAEFPLIDNKVPVSGSLKLYVENVLQVEDTNFSIDDYTITFKAGYIPGAGHIITASYDYVTDTKVFESYDDELLERLIEAATKIAENQSGRTFIQGTITENRIGNGDRLLSLHWLPIVSVTSVKLDGVALTKDTDYIELLDMGWLKRSSGWTKDKAIIIVYIAGYGEGRDATQALVPDAVTAVLLILADLYENRGDTVDSINISGLGSTSFKLPSRAEKILNRLKPQGGFA